MKKDVISPKNIAKYFLLLSQRDGELITPLKMQKMIYFAYAVYLLQKKGRDKLFQERIEAWPSGPVIPSLYRDLKRYGFSSIDSEFVDITVEDFEKKYLGQKELKGLLEEVYSYCQRLTPFQLVEITHREKAWLEARKGLEPHERSNNPLKDEDILAEYAKK
jgi:uncharacterized phage-associated protein